MFNKLKQIKDLREKAKKIQSVLADEKIEHTTKGITMMMDGNQQLISVHVDDEVMQDKARMEAALVDAFNETIKKAQKAIAMKLSKSGELDLPF